MKTIRPDGRRPPGLRPAAWAATVLLAVGGLALAGGGQHALAATAAPSCANGTCAVTFTTGTGQSFTVPAGVTSLSVTLDGAGGGSYVGRGGDGAQVTATLAVTPGANLGVDVGGAGGEYGSAGINGGGASDYGGGGGATDITLSGTRLLVAGGGGGGADGGTAKSTCLGASQQLAGGDGGNADSAGGNGAGVTADGLTITGGSGGAAGTATAAGAGGAAGSFSGANPCAEDSEFPGVAGQSGSGSTGGEGSDGGGGGGGYFGGGSGSSGSELASHTDGSVQTGSGGGGGGSSYTGGAGVSDATVSDVGTGAEQNGSAVFSYADPVSGGSLAVSTGVGQPLSVDAAGGLLSAASAPAGDSLTASGPSSGQTAQGGTVSVNADGSFTYTPPSGFDGSDSFGYTVTDASGDYATGTVTITVSQLAQAISFTAPATGTVGQSATLTATGGGSGNPVTFSADPSSDAGACSVSGDTVSYTGAGTCVIDANQAGAADYSAAPQVQGSIAVADVPVAVTVTGSQAYGSGSPQFSYDAPSGVTVSGSVTCGTVNGGTAIGTSLDAGSYTIDGSGCSGLTVPAGYALSYTGGAFTVSQASQTVSFTPPASGTAGQTATLTATGGASGNPVTFSVDPLSDAGACSVSGDTVSYTGAGTCVIDAGQAGDADYAAAAQVQGSITVQQGPAFYADTPSLTAAAGAAYSYQFAAAGTPAPSYALAGGAPSWLSVDGTGLVSGTPPAGTKTFSYSVVASNAAGSVTAGPFTVTVAAAVTKANVSVSLKCPASLKVGASGQCTLTVTNAGPAVAAKVVAGAAIPALLKVTACSPGCTRAGGVLVWSLGSLPAGQSQTLTITVTAGHAGTALVAAAAGAANPDPNPFNNLAAAAIKVTR